MEAGTLEQTAESLARTRLWGLDCAAEVLDKAAIPSPLTMTLSFADDIQQVRKRTVRLSLSGRWNCPQNGQTAGHEPAPFGTTWHYAALRGTRVPPTFSRWGG